MHCHSETQTPRCPVKGLGVQVTSTLLRWELGAIHIFVQFFFPNRQCLFGGGWVWGYWLFGWKSRKNMYILKI